MEVNKRKIENTGSGIDAYRDRRKQFGQAWVYSLLHLPEEFRPRKPQPLSSIHHFLSLTPPANSNHQFTEYCFLFPKLITEKRNLREQPRQHPQRENHAT